MRWRNLLLGSFLLVMVGVGFVGGSLLANPGSRGLGERVIETLQRQASATQPSVASDPCANEAQLVDFWEATYDADVDQVSNAMAIPDEALAAQWQAVADSAWDSYEDAVDDHSTCLAQNP